MSFPGRTGGEPHRRSAHTDIATRSSGGGLLCPLGGPGAGRRISSLRRETTAATRPAPSDPALGGETTLPRQRTVTAEQATGPRRLSRPVLGPVVAVPVALTLSLRIGVPARGHGRRRFSGPLLLKE